MSFNLFSNHPFSSLHTIIKGEVTITNALGETVDDAAELDVTDQQKALLTVCREGCKLPLQLNTSIDESTQTEFAYNAHVDLEVMMGRPNRQQAPDDSQLDYSKTFAVDMDHGYFKADTVLVEVVVTGDYLISNDFR